MTETTREENVFMAKVCEQAERYDDMVEAIKKVALLENIELTVEERNLLSVAYKNVIGARRASWRILSSIEQKQANNENNVRRIRNYRQKIEAEMTNTYHEIINILENHLIPISDRPHAHSESKVFYRKMQGDYWRYFAEISTGEARMEADKRSNDAYDEAAKISSKELHSCHPIRLGLALSLSVFYYDILNQPEKACEIAKKAFDDAIAEIDCIGEDSYQECCLQLQILRDNLLLWTAEPKSDAKEEGDDEDDEEEED